MGFLDDLRGKSGKAGLLENRKDIRVIKINKVRDLMNFRVSALTEKLL